MGENIIILFKPEHVDPILKGLKTQTRRGWTKPRVCVGSIQLAKTQMISKEYFCKLLIKRVWKESLKDMSLEDCKAELCNSMEEYIDLFWNINEKNLKKQGWTRENIENMEVYAVEFEVYKSKQITFGD